MWLGGLSPPTYLGPVSLSEAVEALSEYDRKYQENPAKYFKSVVFLFEGSRCAIDGSGVVPVAITSCGKTPIPCSTVPVEGVSRWGGS